MDNLFDKLETAPVLGKILAIVLLPALAAAFAYVTADFLLSLVGEVNIPGVIAGWIYGLVILFIYEIVKAK